MTTTTVRIPTPLRPLCGGKDEVQVGGATIQELVDQLEAAHKGIKPRLLDDKGQLRRFVNLYLGDEDVRHLQGLETRLTGGQTLTIVPAIAGGATSAEKAEVSWSELHQELRRRIPEITVDELRRQVEAGSPPVLVDVRETEELEQGRLPGARHVPRGYLEMSIEEEVADRDAPVVLYCGGGTRSLLAADALQRMGYRNVRSLAGGFRGWSQAGLRIDKPRRLSPAERRRFARHLAIPEVGEEGQVKLLESRVLMVGAGGLGCPAALYLAAAGVGTLGIIDFDLVDESNLQRQVLHSTDRVGTPKIESARKTLQGINPELNVVPYEERLSSANVERIVGQGKWDVVVDGSDNFPTRYLINDACVLWRLPCVHGSVYRFEGQVTVFDPARGGPCYRCLYPEPPPAELAPSCADAGVLGILPGVIGLLEAVETIKLILGAGTPLAGRLITYDALATRFRELKLRRDPGCAYCGDGRPFPGFIDYEQFCRLPGAS